MAFTGQADSTTLSGKDAARPPPLMILHIPLAPCHRSRSWPPLEDPARETTPHTPWVQAYIGPHSSEEELIPHPDTPSYTLFYLVK